MIGGSVAPSELKEKDTRVSRYEIVDLLVAFGQYMVVYLFCPHFSAGPPRATIFHMRNLGLSNNHMYQGFIVNYHGF